MNELPLELLIQILSPLGARDLIKCRAVNKRWRIVIDEYLLLELNLFTQPHPADKSYSSVTSIFQAHNRTSSNLKRTILHVTPWNPWSDHPRIKNITKVHLDKIQFLFRNVRTLSVVDRQYCKEPMNEFISKSLLGGRRWRPSMNRIIMRIIIRLFEVVY